jgi:hypothetical protein
MNVASLLWKLAIGLAAICVVVALSVFLLARKPVPATITYGLSFSAPYAQELGLDPHTVFRALLDDLGVRHFRLAAYWPSIEPQKGQYDFSETDYEVSAASDAGADIIMAVGRRLPRWPECHVPDWAAKESWEDQKAAILEYMTRVVERYKDEPSIIYWQVENEPYLSLFGSEACGSTLDTAFLKEEVALVHSLDPSRPVLLTDSGNLGTWFGAYKNGDAFGTSVYVYFWTPELGAFRTILPPWFYRFKEGVMRLLYGEKQTFLIELSGEPWLLAPVEDTPLDVQYERMNLQKFDEILDYAKDTRFDRQYLWGGEWWYWLKLQGNSEMWDRAKELF